MLDAVRKEGILLADDLGRHLEDRPGALVEALDQPVGRLQAIGDVGPVGVVAGAFRHPGVVGLVDEDARQRVRIELDMPAAVRCRAHHGVRYHRLDHGTADGVAGLRIERPHLGEHLGKILGVDPADAHQCPEIAPRHQFEIGEQRGHRRVEAVALAELNGQAFGEIARPNSGRLEALHDGEHALDIGDRCAKPLGDPFEIGADIARLVDLVDQREADQAVARVVDGQSELVGEMVGERLLAGDEGLEIVVLGADRQAGGGDRPGLGRQRRRDLARGVSVVVGKDIGEVGVELPFDDVGVGFEPGLKPLGRLLAVLSGAVELGGIAISVGCFGPFVVGFRPFQKRVPLEFGVDIGDKVEIGKLEQFDRLHQLRRHHQRLALPEFELLRKRHTPMSLGNWSEFCLSPFLGSRTRPPVKG